MVVRNPSSKFRFVFLLLLLLLMMMMMMMMMAFFWTTIENSLFKTMIKLLWEPTKRAFTLMQHWSQSLIPIFFLFAEIFHTTKYNTCKRNCFVVCHRYNLCKSVARTSLLLKNFYFTLLYGCVSQGLRTTEFTNLIGWTRYWPRSRFSHLYERLDWLHFAVKKSHTKIQKCWPFSSKNIYLWKCQKAWWETSKADEQTFADLSSAYRRSQAKCQLVQVTLNELIFFLFAM